MGDGDKRRLGRQDNHGNPPGPGKDGEVPQGRLGQPPDGVVPKDFDSALYSFRYLLEAAAFPMLALSLMVMSNTLRRVIVLLSLVVVVGLRLIERRRFTRSIRDFDGTCESDRESIWERLMPRSPGQPTVHV